MTGKLTKFTEEDYQSILKDLAEGVPLSKSWGGERPGKTLFHRKVATDAAFAQDYSRAMVMRAQARIAKIEDVIDQVLSGRAEPAAAKVALDSLRWLCQKEDPARYSDIQRSEVSGPGGKDLISNQPQLSDRELARLLAYLLNKGARQPIDAGDLIPLPEPAT